MNAFKDIFALTLPDSIESTGSNGPNIGGWVVIIIVAVLLVQSLFSGAGWDAIDSLLGIGFLAYLFFNWFTR